jgi:hypothetical protein
LLTNCFVDVVARRRLRASQSQIQQVTRAARNKRMEFEAVLYSWTLADIYTIKDLKERENFYPSRNNGHLGGNARRILQLQRTQQQQMMLQQQQMQILQQQQQMHQQQMMRPASGTNSSDAQQPQLQQQTRSRSSSADSNEDATVRARGFRPSQNATSERNNRYRGLLCVCVA